MVYVRFNAWIYEPESFIKMKIWNIWTGWGAGGKNQVFFMTNVRHFSSPQQKVHENYIFFKNGHYFQRLEKLKM